MQYSLRDRFRGAFLGAAIGEMIGTDHSIRPNAALSSAQSSIPGRREKLWEFPPSDRIDPIAKKDWGSQNGWGKLLIQQTEDLVQPLSEAKDGDPCNSSHLEDRAESVPLDAKGQPITVSVQGSLAITTIPIALFHHDHLRHLPHRIEQTITEPSMTRRQHSANLATGAIVIGYTLALALQEKLHPHDLIPRLLTDLDLHDRDFLLTQQLQQVQSCLEQGYGLAMIKSLMPVSQNPAIDPAPIAMALYGFLSTPNFFQLSLRRSIRLTSHPQIVCCLVGALSGVYNSVAGLPIGWRTRLNGVGTQPIVGNLPSESKLIEQADRLFAAWSGVYQPSQSPEMVTALPDLIRPRPDLPAYLQ
ncbi:hypothetical protein [Egbenema bharatensis]|uniref:hypothetical protein n=1 Tax=Egbenema bharatensis TaxID=3463334 RepID=UPI003A86B4B1